MMKNEKNALMALNIILTKKFKNVMKCGAGHVARVLAPDVNVLVLVKI